MVDLAKYKITIENPKGSYKSLESENSTYPLKGVTYPVDYGCIEGYEGEDEAELDIFVGTGDIGGYIIVWRLDVPTETKFFANVTRVELESILEVFKPVLVGSKILEDEEFCAKVEEFKKI